MNTFRYSFILILIVFFISCENDPRPNKISFMIFPVDDLGYNDLSFMGSEYYETPNVDYIANNGMNI